MDGASIYDRALRFDDRGQRFGRPRVVFDDRVALRRFLAVSWFAARLKPWNKREPQPENARNRQWVSVNDGDTGLQRVSFQRQRSVLLTSVPRLRPAAATGGVQRPIESSGKRRSR